MTETTVETRLAKLELQGDVTNQALGRMELAITAMAESLQKLQLAEAKRDENFKALDRAFSAIRELKDDHLALSQKFYAIDKELEVPRVIKNWVMAGVTGILALVGMGVWKLVVGQ